MRTATYHFDELALRSHNDIVVATVSGWAECDIQGDKIVTARIHLLEDMNRRGEPRPVLVLPLTPLHDLCLAEIKRAFAAGMFGEDPAEFYRDENDEHRLTASMVL